MKRVFVCAGMNLANNAKINHEAELIGDKLGTSGNIYVQGGSNQGLMGLTLNAFLKHSKNVEFFIPEKYYNYDAPELINLVGQSNFKATKTLGEAGRLKNIIKCDEIIVLPGGSGTLEELLFCNETKRAGEHSCNITVVNIDGFFNGYLNQMKRNIEEGLTKPSAIQFKIVNSVNEINFSSQYSFEN